MIFLSLSHPLHPHSYSGVYRHLHSFPPYVSNALHRLHSRGGATVVTLNTGNQTFNSGLISSFILNRPFPLLLSHPTSGHHLTSSLSSHLTGHSFAFVYLTCPFHLLSPLPSFLYLFSNDSSAKFVYICL